MNKVDEFEKKLNELNEEFKTIKKDIKNNSKYKVVNYAGYDWYVINEDSEKTLLLMKNRLLPKDLKKYFPNELFDSDGDIIFSPESSNKWCDSSIRMCLNGKFLENFDLDDIVKSEITLEYSDGEEITTKDYIRLLTKEEAEDLPEEIRKIDYQYGWWLLSPWSARANIAWYVPSTGYVNHAYTGWGLAVRPAVYLKSSILSDCESK